MSTPLYAIPLAGAAAWIAGAAWYGVLGKTWIAALGTTREQLMGPSGRPDPAPFILSFVADCAIAGGLAMLAPALGGALPAALFAWAAFVLTTLGVNNAFARRRPMLTVIDAGHWLVAMLAAGVVLHSLAGG